MDAQGELTVETQSLATAVMFSGHPLITSPATPIFRMPRLRRLPEVCMTRGATRYRILLTDQARLV